MVPVESMMKVHAISEQWGGLVEMHGNELSRCDTRASSLVFLLLILADNTIVGHGVEEEHAYIHWPPAGSRVSKASLSSAGIRVEFAGLKSYPFAYRASFSVAFGNSTTVSARPYDIESNRIHPLSSPSSGIGVDAAQLIGRATSNWTIRSLVTSNGTAARWLIPFVAAFSWDGMSHVMDDALGDDPLGFCEESDLEEHVTLSIRLLRGRADENDLSKTKQWSDVAAQASISMRLLVGYGDISVFGNSDEDDGSVEGEARSERIVLADFMEPPRQLFTALSLARAGFTAVIRGLHPFSPYTVTLTLNDSTVLSEHLLPLGPYFSLQESRDDDDDDDDEAEPAWLKGMRDDGRDKGSWSRNLWTRGRQIKLHSNLPLLPQGSHRARVEVRVGSGTRPAATSEIDLVVVGDDVEGAFGYVAPTTVGWVHDQAWCADSDSNAMTCTPRGYRAQGEGIPKVMRSAEAVCQALHEAGVRRIRVYGDSFARHIYAALSIITSGDFSRGALDDDEQGKNECCGEGQFSDKVCRLKISSKKKVCGGNVMLVREERWSPWQHSISTHDPSDLILLSEGRHAIGFPALFAHFIWQSWFLPFWVPAPSPWEGEGECNLTNWDSIHSWVKAFCRPFRSTSVSERAQGGNSTGNARMIFVNWHVNAHSPKICGRLKGNRYFEDSHERIKAYFRLNESQCAQREYREWTPDCNQSMASIEGIGDVGNGIPCMKQQDPIISATSRSWGSAILSNCGENAAVVDVMPVTRALVDNHLDDAIDMTYDGLHWASAVNTLLAQMIVHQVWQRWSI